MVLSLGALTPRFLQPCGEADIQRIATATDHAPR